MKASHKKIILDAITKMEEAKTALEQLATDLQESIDGRSDKWREGEAGELAQSEQSAVEESASSIESALDSLGQIEGLTDN